jgi:hypothetical protein
MTAITLCRSDPTRNLHRYYRLAMCSLICLVHGALFVNGAA